MLPYHIINPQKREQNDSEFVHYLSLGSYTSSFEFENLLSFSKIMLTPKKHLPKLNYDDEKAKIESKGLKLHTLMIPLYGEFMVDGKAYKNLLEEEATIQSEKPSKLQQKAVQSKVYEVKEVNTVTDAEYISNKAQKDHNATFLYFLYKTLPAAQSSEVQGHQGRFSSLINQKKIIYHKIKTVQSDSIQISFIQALEDIKVALKQNDLVYLEKGRISLIQSKQSSVEIRNKGNQKGQNNYVENLVFVAEDLQAQVQKGSLIFLIGAEPPTYEINEATQ